MKNDLRLNYPLWMMGFIVLLGIFAYGVHSPVKQFSNNENEMSLFIQFDALESLLVFGSLFLYLVLLILFLVKIRQHNKSNPHQKISLFSVRPPEYLEQDEGMKYITSRAVQKVYSFYSWAMPALATVIILLPIPRLLIIYGILALAFIQYVIYYMEVRRHFKEEAE